MTTKKKSGAPDPKYFESADTIGKFDPVRQWLIKNFKKYTHAEPPSNKSLATLCCNMLQFQEEAFGKHVSNPALTKLPVSLFEDLSAGGSLCQILATAYRVKTEQSWRRFDFHSPARIDRGLELFMSIHRDLKESKVWEPPRVFFDGSVGSQLSQQLMDVVKRHQGTVVESADEASHVIYPPPPPNPNPEEEYIRPLAIRGKMVLVHWWYFPDSYDSTLSLNEVGGVSPETPPPKPKQWLVSSRWLTDTDTFNEWACEEDYEVIAMDGRLQRTAPYLGLTRRKAVKAPVAVPEEHETPEPSRRDRRSHKRRRTPSPSPPTETKRSRKSRTASRRTTRAKELEEEEDVTKDLPLPPPVPKVEEVPAGQDSREVTPTSTKLVELTPATTPAESEQAMDTLEPASQPAKEAVGASPAGSDPSSQRSSQQQSQQQETPAAPSAPGGGSQPVSGGKALSEQEKRILEQKDPFPREDTAITQANSIVIPSYAAWFDYGSINAIEKRSLPEYFSGKNRSKTPEIYMAYRNFMVDSFRLNPQEYLSVTACRRNLAGDVGAILRVHGFLEQWGLINHHVEPDKHAQAMGPPSTAHFNVQVDTPMGIQPLPPGKSASDHLIQFPEKSGGEKEGEAIDNFGLRSDALSKSDESSGRKAWSDQETLLLLEGLELHRDDWNKVSQHVGSRTQDECILHFLKLPIEDSYLEEKSLGPLAHQPVPFSQQGNPVMSTVAFLASVVDPRVASAAAKAALAEFTKMKDEPPNSFHKLAASAPPTAPPTATPTVGEKEPQDQASEKTTGSTPPPPPPAQPSTEEQQPGTSQPSKTPPLGPPTEGNVQTAAAAALASAAVKARHLASVEERKIKSLVALLVETQMKKLEIKLRYFEELEAIMDRERESLELQRQQLLSDRQQFQRDQLKAAEIRALQSPTLQPQTPLQLPPIRPPHRSPPTPLTPATITRAGEGKGAEGGSETANVQTPSVAMETAVSQPEGAGTEEVGVSQEAGPPATQEADADQQGAAEPSQAPAPSSGEDGLPAEVGGATMEGGVVTSEGDLLQMSEFQLPAGEEVPMGSGEEGAGVLPDDVIQETPPEVEDTASQDLWEDKGVPVDPLVMGEGVEGEAVMAEEQFSGPGGEDRTGSDLPPGGPEDIAMDDELMDMAPPPMLDIATPPTMDHMMSTATLPVMDMAPPPAVVDTGPSEQPPTEQAPVEGSHDPAEGSRELAEGSQGPTEGSHEPAPPTSEGPAQEEQ